MTDRVSYWSALHFHGLAEQVPRTVFVATTRKRRPLEFDRARFVFVRVAPYKFFGYQREMVGDLPMLMAQVEKALVDSLDQLRYVCSRLGYLLDRFGQPVEGLDISQSFVRLDPQGEAEGPYDRRWRVRVNVSDAELLQWRET